eukprot:TRINITY_DN69897_c0_g1_i1.p1 TRINITY_DN69897_c0_g1~~TRINITY_DN69897_c0_g1_i1.p1  ORF type:complete len:436 (-),score=69.33 TRINITY_DN69897_c0_g1_i1:533-1840(-)
MSTAEKKTPAASKGQNLAASVPPERLISADDVAGPFRSEIKSLVTSRYAGRAPKLVGFLANSDPHARRYADWTGRACRADGLRYELIEASPEELESLIDRANADPDVHGVIIYYPVFGAAPSYYGGSQDDYLRDAVSYTKDVEGLGHVYRSLLYHNVRYTDDALTRKSLLPCTPLAVVKILDFAGLMRPAAAAGDGDRLAGRTVTVINRSEVVGRPLAAMLANDGAVVYSVDIETVYKLQRGRMLDVRSEVTTEAAVRQSDAVVLAVPSASYRMPPEWLREGAVVVNVASTPNIDFEEATKVPGVRICPSVGKVTVSMLERNVVRLFENYGRKTTDGLPVSVPAVSPAGLVAGAGPGRAPGTTGRGISGSTERASETVGGPEEAAPAAPPSKAGPRSWRCGGLAAAVRSVTLSAAGAFLALLLYDIAYAVCRRRF